MLILDFHYLLYPAIEIDIHCFVKSNLLHILLALFTFHNTQVKNTVSHRHVGMESKRSDSSDRSFSGTVRVSEV